MNPHAEALGEALNALGAPLGAAVTATQSGAIAEAVQSYFDTVESPRIQGMSARIGAATSGVVSATEAYVTGDLAMAADAQAASIAAATPASLPLGTD